MRHEIEHIREGYWAPAVMVWDDVAGTLQWTRQPAVEDHMDPILMQRLVDKVDRARREGRVVIGPRGVDPRRWVLDDAAHDPADFLRLIDLDNGCVRCGDVRLPPSLRDVEMTPHEPLPLRPPGAIVLDGPWDPGMA